MDATAEALAPDITEAPKEPEFNEDAALGAIFDKNEAPEEPVSEPVEEKPAPEEPAAEKPTEETVSEDVDVPSDLPKPIREKWKDLPEDVRRSFLDSQREMSRKLGDNGRLMQGLKPIQDTLVEAVSKFPTLKDMSPAEVAKRTFALAELDNKMRTDPDAGAKQLAEAYPDLARAVASHIGGQPQSQNLLAQANQRIEHLERQLKQVANPEYLREQFSTFSQETSVQSQVENFARTAEHWAEVENSMPSAIAYVRETQPNASAEDVLKAAYDLEVRRLGKATPDNAAVEAASVADPLKTEKALKAKSVNVRSQPSGKDRVKTEDELLDEVWRKNHA